MRVSVTVDKYKKVIHFFYLYTVIEIQVSTFQKKKFKHYINMYPNIKKALRYCLTLFKNILVINCYILRIKNFQNRYKNSRATLEPRDCKETLVKQLCHTHHFRPSKKNLGTHSNCRSALCFFCYAFAKFQ